MRLLFWAMIVLSCLCGCRNNRVMRDLREVDSLMRNDKDSVAGKLLKNIKVNSLNKEPFAYYSLLKTEFLFRQGLTLSSDSMIDKSVSFYLKTGNHHELSRAYYFKAQMNYRRKDYKSATVLFKSAENEISKTDDHLLKSRIYMMLGDLNSRGGNINGALLYAKKGYAEAVYAGDKEQQAQCLNNIAKAFNSLNNKDSVRYYIDKSFALIEYVDSFKKALLLGNVARTYAESDLNKAKHYAEMSLSVKKHAAGYQALANIYSRIGLHDSCEYCLNEGLKICDDLTRKASILTNLLECKKQSGRYEDAADISLQLLTLRDSIGLKMRSDSIKEMQIIYESVQKTKKDGNTLKNIIVFAIVVVFVLAITCCLLFRKYYRNRDELQFRQKRIDIYGKDIKTLQYRINRLEKTQYDKAEEIRFLKARLKNTVEKYDEAKMEKEKEVACIVNDGERLFAHLSENKPIGKWGRDDIVKMIKYYRIAKPDFFDVLDGEYRGLSDRQTFYLILEDLGKSDNDIMSILSLGYSGLRSCRVRLENKRK